MARTQHLGDTGQTSLPADVTRRSLPKGPTLRLTEGPAYLRGLVGDHDALPASDRVIHILREVVALHTDEVAGWGRLSCREGTLLQGGAQPRPTPPPCPMALRHLPVSAPWASPVELRLAALVPSGSRAQQPCPALPGTSTRGPRLAGRTWGEAAPRGGPSQGPCSLPGHWAQGPGQVGGLTFVEVPPELMVGAALHDLSDVLCLLVDGHGADGGAWGRRRGHLDLDGARLGNLAVQLLQEWGVLERRGPG